MTSLHTACSEGNASRVREYIKLGADINSRDNAKWTPLHEASLNGHFDCVEILLAHGAMVDCASHSGDTPLMDAAANGHRECVLLLLEYGADVSTVNKDGKSASDFINEYHDGSSSDRETIIEYLERPSEYWIPHRKPEFVVQELAEESVVAEDAMDISRPASEDGSGKARRISSKSEGQAAALSANSSAGGAYRDFSTKSLAAYWGTEGEQTQASGFSSSREERKFQALLKTLEKQDSGASQDTSARRKSTQSERRKVPNTDDEDEDIDVGVPKRLPAKKRASIPHPIKVASPVMEAMGSPTSSDAPVKRKRGRPRKAPLPVNLSHIKSETDEDDEYASGNDNSALLKQFRRLSERDDGTMRPCL